MAVIITSPRGTRADWDEGLFDALVIAVHVLGNGHELAMTDRTVLTVAALRFWPNNSVVTMVGRVLAVEETIVQSGYGCARAMLTERDTDTHLRDALFRPILFASTLRDYSEDEIDRLGDAVTAAGIAPQVFGLPR